MLSGTCLTLLSISACAQDQPVENLETKVRDDLYACQGCEGASEPDPASLSHRTVIAGADEPGEPLHVFGTVYHTDGTTPAADIVLYFYHTNAEGLYAGGSDKTQQSRLHGRLRGWVKTGSDGRYHVITIKPAPYPDGTTPAHIHPTVLEPGKPPYWIDNVVFDGEFGVTSAYKRKMTDKGGAGIVPLSKDAEGTWIAVRDIILEHHPE